MLHNLLQEFIQFLLLECEKETLHFAAHTQYIILYIWNKQTQLLSFHKYCIKINYTKLIFENKFFKYYKNILGFKINLSYLPLCERRWLNFIQFKNENVTCKNVNSSNMANYKIPESDSKLVNKFILNLIPVTYNNNKWTWTM